MSLATTGLGSDANLVALYQLEDTSDSKGTFTLTNTGGAAFNAAKFNNGVDFGSGNSTKSLTNAGNLVTTGSVSISFWMKNNRDVVGTDSAQEYDLVSLGITNNADYRIIYVYNGGTQQLRFIRSGASGTEIDVGTVMSTSSFQHVAMTYDASNIIAYIDNVAKGTISATGTAANHTGIYIGRDIGGNDAWAQTIIDDVGIFSRALSGAEVGTIYNDTAAPATGRTYMSTSSKFWGG